MCTYHEASDGNERILTCSGYYIQCHFHCHEAENVRIALRTRDRLLITAQKDAGRTGDVREDRGKFAMLLMRLSTKNIRLIF